MNRNVKPPSRGQGPKFDRVMRSLAQFAPSVFCHAFTDDARAPAQALSESFPAGTRVPDQLFSVAPDRLAHFEFERHASWRLVPRMLAYRGLIMEKHRDRHLDQYVVVLGTGRVHGHDDLQSNGFALDLRITYLRDEDPRRFLTHPVLAPLAVLGRGGPAARAAALTEALTLIGRQGGDLASDLLEASGVMATIHLDRSTIDAAVKETGMSIESIASFYEGTELGRELVRRGHAEGREEGRQEGRQEGLRSGREQGAARMLAVILRERFGDRPEIELLSRRLASTDAAQALHAIEHASSLEELLGASRRED